MIIRYTEEAQEYLDKKAGAYVLHMLNAFNIGGQYYSVNNYIYLFNGRLVLVKGCKSSFATAKSYPDPDIPVVSQVSWSRYIQKPDAYILYNDINKHFIVLGASTSREWKDAYIDGEMYYTCPRHMWKSSTSFIDRLKTVHREYFRTEV